MREGMENGGEEEKVKKENQKRRGKGKEEKKRKKDMKGKETENAMTLFRIKQYCYSSRYMKVVTILEIK